MANDKKDDKPQKPREEGERILPPPYDPFKKPRGRNRAFDTVEEMTALALDYFKICKQQNRPLTISGLCVHLNVDKETLLLYGTGKYDDQLNNFSGTIKQIKLIIETDKVENGLAGIYQPHIVKFDLANNHGWKEKNEISGDPAAPISLKEVSKDMTLEEAQRAYQEAMEREAGGGGK